MLFRLRRIRPTLAERAAPRLPAHATRVLRCYRCGASFEASAFAESTSCPKCAGAVRTPDLLLDKGHWGGSIQTAGTVRVPHGATVRSSLIVASGDVLIEGRVYAMIIAGGTVRIAAGGELRGGARCRTLVVDPGALIRGGPFEAPSDALGTVDIDTAARSIPGKGPAAHVEALTASSAMEIEGKPLIITAPQTPAGPPPRLRVVR
tara:strand:- start:5418 stop:6035 length:618 start_codon:yes stop_codon:yes gene_type:complete